MEQNTLITKTHTQNSTFISKCEYSYFLQDRSEFGAIGSPEDCGWMRMSEKITIHFKNGEIIEYGLGLKTWNELIVADSVGKFFHKNIKSKFGVHFKKIR